LLIMHSVSLVPYLSTSFFPPNDHAQNPGSTFCFVVVVAAGDVLLAIIANFVMVARQVVYYGFRHGCKSGSCVSRQIESRQFTSH
jgi:hypothetical protein